MGMITTSVWFQYVEHKMKTTDGSFVNINNITSNASIIIHLPTSYKYKYKILEIPISSAGKDNHKTYNNNNGTNWSFKYNTKKNIFAILRVNW